MDVYVADYDIDRHGAGCDCGVCNSNGKSYGVALYAVDAQAYSDDPLDVLYGPSYDAAYHNARLEAATQGWRVVRTDEEYRPMLEEEA